MATNEANNTDLTRAEILWKAADTLRGQIDADEEQEDDGESFTEKYPRLLADLEACFGEGDRLKGVGDAG